MRRGNFDVIPPRKRGGLLTRIKSLIEENNAVLRVTIQALEMLSGQAREILTNQTLQQLPQPILPSRNYPGYTTPVKYGFMTIQ